MGECQVPDAIVLETRVHMRQRVEMTAGGPDGPDGLALGLKRSDASPASPLLDLELQTWMSECQHSQRTFEAQQDA